MTPGTIEADVTVPTRSRTFTTDDAQAVLDLFQGRALVKDDEGNPVLDDNGQPTYEDKDPAKNVGYGTFNTQGAARSAAVTLNRLLSDLGAPQKYAATTFQRDGKVVGVLLNKPAKQKSEETEEAEPAAEPAPAPARRSRQGSGRRSRS